MKKIVIKVGTSALTQGTQKLSRRHMLELVQQMAELQNQGVQLVLVSSGAVATGQELLSSCDPLLSKQTYASIGQVKLMHRRQKNDGWALQPQQALLDIPS